MTSMYMYIINTTSLLPNVDTSTTKFKSKSCITKIQHQMQSLVETSRIDNCT